MVYLLFNYDKSMVSMKREKNKEKKKRKEKGEKKTKKKVEKRKKFVELKNVIKFLLFNEQHQIKHTH